MSRRIGDDGTGLPTLTQGVVAISCFLTEGDWAGLKERKSE